MAGKKQSEEHKKKLSKSLTLWWSLNKNSEHARLRAKKISDSLLGKPTYGRLIPPPKEQTGTYKFCDYCDVEFYVLPSGKGRKFCSHGCYVKDLRKNGSHLKKDLQDTNSVTSAKTKMREIVNECMNCGFDDHRILELHHVDRDKTNNLIENLQMLCPNCHAVSHYEEKSGMYHNLKH